MINHNNKQNHSSTKTSSYETGETHKPQSTLSKEDTTDQSQLVGGTIILTPEIIEETQAESVSQEGLVRAPELPDLPPSEDSDPADQGAEPDTEINVVDNTIDRNVEQTDLIDSLINELRKLSGTSDSSAWRAAEIVYELEMVHKVCVCTRFCTSLKVRLHALSGQASLAR